jgi:hypothetical protein
VPRLHESALIGDVMYKIRRFLHVVVAVIALAAVVSSPAKASAAGPPVPLTAAALSNGWAIQRMVVNDMGAVVFTGGDFQGLADGIVFSSLSSYYRIANFGYEPPGTPGSAFVGFPGRHYGDLALNRAGDVVFSASLAACVPSYPGDPCLGSNPRVNGLFHYRDYQGRRIALEGDPVPGRGGYVFRSFDRIWLNAPGDTVFRSGIYNPASPSESYSGLFLYSNGRIQTVAVEGDPSPLIDVSSDRFALSLSDDDVVLFFSPRADAVYRFAGGVLSTVISSGVRVGPNEILRTFYAAVPNRNGDVVLHAPYGPDPSQQGIYLLGHDGDVVRILADGDPTPAGGQFALWAETTDRFGGRHQVPVGLSLKLNDAGEVLFATPVRQGTTSAGLFTYHRGEIGAIVVDGGARPDDATQSFGFSYQEIQYALNNTGLAAFSPARAGLFLALGRDVAAIALNGESTGPIESGEYSIDQFSTFVLNENRTVAFQASLCCGPYVQGIFVAKPRTPAVPNGGFEGADASGLPSQWTTWWVNFGEGDAAHYNSGGTDSYDWYSTLRLHVGPAGGAVFVVSDPTAVFPGATYMLECRMRFFFDDPADMTFFTIIQYDRDGATVGLNEVLGVAGDSRWSWEPKRLLIQAAPNAAFLRYRFGLMSSHEKYLDVDALQ